MKVIAECGCNFHSIEEAFIMIERAYEIGCWAAKFQAFSKEYCLDNNLPNRLSLDYVDVKGLFGYGKKVGIEVFFTPFDVERVQWCEDIGVNYYKIRYADNKNAKLLIATQKTKKPIFVSGDNNNYFDGSTPNIINLFCIPKYPSSYLDYMTPTNPYYRNFNFKGVSDHTFDLELFLKHSVGYKYWEKHVCLTKDCLESDWSVTFEELEKVLEVNRKE